MLMTRSQLQRYGIAVVAVAQALLLKLLLVPQVEAENSFLLFFVAVTVSAGYGGFGPGLLATALAALTRAYFFISPAYSVRVTWDEILWLVVFVLLALLISVVAAAHRQAEEVLKARACQQAGVAKLGQQALSGIGLDSLMKEAVSLVAQTLEVECCKLLELLRDRNTFILRAGVGWQEGLVGHTMVGAQTDSHAGYTLLSSEPVIVEDWRTETRFNRPPLHNNHGLLSGMSVIIDGQDPPFGVLGVYTTRRRTFTQDDIHFLQAIANVLAEAIARKQVEEALRESEEQYRGLVELSPDTIFVQSEGKVVFVNQAGATLLGAEDPKELIGKLILDIVHPDCQEVVKTRMRQVTEAAKPVPFLEERFLRLDGSSVDVEVAAVPFSYNGQRAAQAVVRDITERKRAEEVLRESEERFRLLVEGVQDYAIFMLDPDGRVASWNLGAERILGYPESEVLGQPFSQFFTLEAIECGEPEKELRRALATGRSEDERWHVRKDGTRFWASGVVTPLQDRQLRGFSKVMRDITERKQTEEALQKRNQRLQLLSETASYLLLNDQPQELIDSLFQQLSAHLELEIYFNYLVDDDRQALQLNSYGGVPDEVAQQIERLQFGQSVCGSVAQQRHQIVAENIQQSIDRETELVRRTLGTTAYACFPLLAHGRLIGTFFFGTRKRSSFDRDELALMQTVCDQLAMAMERTRLTLVLQQRAEELAAANRMKDEFLATLSHELRTPLNAILGWARLLRTRKFNEDTTAGALETIERNAKSQAQLVEDLLDVSRIVQGKLRLNLCPCELIPVIESAIASIRPAADAQGIQLESRLDSEVTVLGDSNRLQQVVWNLFSNAVKFTPKGGRVEVKLTQVGSQAQISVSDTGRGISADFLPYVFDRFRQFDSTSTRSYGGIGLGLAIVRQLVELHGGTVEAESPGEGQGAKFTVGLPLITARRSEGDASLGAPAVGALSSISGNGSLVSESGTGVGDLSESGKFPDRSLALDGLHVLVVEDEADTRELLFTVLQQSGARVTAVASVGEALDHLEVDVLVSDIGMPDEDGYTLIRKVRAQESHRKKIPAIALTAYAGEEDRRRALAAGFQMYLPKPVELADLITTITDLVSRTRAKDTDLHPH